MAGSLIRKEKLRIRKYPDTCGRGLKKTNCTSEKGLLLNLFHRSNMLELGFYALLQFFHELLLEFVDKYGIFSVIYSN